jgi:hypothetical protein
MAARLKDIAASGGYAQIVLLRGDGAARAVVGGARSRIFQILDVSGVLLFVPVHVQTHAAA